MALMDRRRSHYEVMLRNLIWAGRLYLKCARDSRRC